MRNREQRRHNEYGNLKAGFLSNTGLLMCVCLFFISLSALCEQASLAEDWLMDMPIVVDIPITTDMPIAVDVPRREDASDETTEQNPEQIEQTGVDTKHPMYASIVEKRLQGSPLAASVNNSAWIDKGIAHIVGDNSGNQCDTSLWPEVVKVRLGNEHAIGMTADGKLVFAGSNAQMQCGLNLQELAVRDIDASAYASYAVLEDGTVRMSGAAYVSEAELNQEENVAAIAAEDTHVVLLHADGTLKAYGQKDTGACDVQDWKNIIMVDCGYGFTIALDLDGRVHMTGSMNYGQDTLRDMTDIVYIAAGSNTCFAIDRQGVVHAAGSNSKGQTDTQAWQNVQVVAAGYRHTVALNAGGKMLGIGENGMNQLEGIN